MLTHIEWWCGVLFVLGAVTYWMSLSLHKKEEGFDWYRIQLHLSSLLPAALLAAYFYPLESKGLQYAYLGVLALALIVMLANAYQEFTSDGSEDSSEGTDGDAAATAQATSEESGGNGVFDVLGYALLYGPVLTACGLGCYRAWPMVQKLMPVVLPG